ncbi:MAG: alkaline phosphatase [Myxococcales bacterium]|nr:MAG: alkaline phosphatase [Myxococcales bacterium]
MVAATGACGDDDDSGAAGSSGAGGQTPLLPNSPEADSHRVFPQGVASGEPTPDSVVLWTRVDAAVATEVSYVVATDEALTQVVAAGTVTASPEADATVRLLITKLAADTRYYYRFATAATTTQVGRTRTAPAADADRAVTYAMASCQDFIGRRYHAWQALLDESADVDFVLFLGDYIYETTGDPQFQTLDPERAITLPDGLSLDGTATNKAAVSLADYRTLYRAYRNDPALREVHRRFPFVILWDDHEFANDCWQDHATDFSEGQGDERSTARRQAASQAWAEYQPVSVVRDATQAFPADLTIYRTLRFGRHVELFITDERLYRADHLIPEGPANTAVAKFSTNSSLGSRNFVLKKGFDPLEAAAAPTMLGAPQKAWLLEKLPASTATWKVWANEVQLWQMAVDLAPYPTVPTEYRDLFYFSCDQWDGYRSERAALLTAFAGVENLVACTGDIHGFYAAELHPDFDQPGATPVAVEYVVAGISSQSTQELTRTTVKGDPLLGALGLDPLIDDFDNVLLTTNAKHLRHSKGGANGFALVTVTAQAFDVTFVTTGNPLDQAATGVVSRARLRTVAGSRTVVPA